ncbi:hypothetical protein HK102_007607 [Quaeritorhiza haematococci]|nr:hypothetical protein HK102_007607 [Quaeritorhiza haematococci]
MGGALSLALASKMSETPNPLNGEYLDAAVSFYGTPPEALCDLSKIPLKTPVQAHFGKLDNMKGFSDLDTAKKVEEKWNAAIQLHGGVHAQGLHKLEAKVYNYEGQGHAFMNDNEWSRKKRQELGFAGEFDQVLVNRAWKRVFDFFTEHLKSV